jgi:hypothetical protein
LTSQVKQAVKENFEQAVVQAVPPEHLISADVCEHRFDLETATSADVLAAFEVPLRFKLNGGCSKVSGVACWFRLGFRGCHNVALATSPSDELTRFRQTKFMLANPLVARPGDVVTGKVSFQPERPKNSFNVELQMEVEGMAHAGAVASNTIRLYDQLWR